MYRLLLILAISLLTTTGCQSQPSVSTKTQSAVVATSDDPREQQLAEARAAYGRDPLDEANIIWLGRRLSYLERFDEAIAVYTKGLQQHPDSYRILRHRGHRYISTRQFELAINDLHRAAALVEGMPIEVEPDGQPNAAGVPRSNTQFNIHYHLGLAHYLTGSMRSAYTAFHKCLSVSNNDDLTCATMHWLYTTLRRMDLHDDAMAFLDEFPAQPEIIENDGYFALIELYRGEGNVDDMLAAIDRDAMTVEDVTIAYGLVNWLELQSRHQVAVRWRAAILASPHRFAFGYIAAETDSRLAR